MAEVEGGGDVTYAGVICFADADQVEDLKASGFGNGFEHAGQVVGIGAGEVWGGDGGAALGNAEDPWFIGDGCWRQWNSPCEIRNLY